MGDKSKTKKQLPSKFQKSPGGAFQKAQGPFNSNNTLPKKLGIRGETAQTVVYATKHQLRRMIGAKKYTLGNYKNMK
jgi:hypothetical protein